MPAVIREGKFLGWSVQPGGDVAGLREREEHAHRWPRHSRSWGRVGDPRSQADPAPAAAEDSVACLVHDLRHLLTRAGFEFEAGDPEAASAATARARALCDEILGGNSDRPVDLSLVCSEEIHSATRLVPGRRVHLPSSDPVRWFGAESAARRLVGNLLLNALRATPPAAEVRIGLRRTDAGICELRITNPGPGLERDSIDDLLGSRRSGQGGTGLGSLSILQCARVLRATIVVHSGGRTGAEFLVQLPG